MNNKIVLSIVVNGKPVGVEGNFNSPLHTIAKEALRKSGNTGQQLENWELKDADGNILDMNRKIEEFGFTEGTTLFLTPGIGIGG
jgi:hypothetical protein